jgi:hypothetical protein
LGDLEGIGTVDQGLFAGFVKPFADRAPVAFCVEVVDRIGVDPRFELAIGEAERFGVGAATRQAFSFDSRRGSALFFPFVLCGKRDACSNQREQDSDNRRDKPDPFHETFLPFVLS